MTRHGHSHTPNVRNYEPHSALRAGADGLRYIRPLIESAHHYLQSPGQLVIEIAATQTDDVLALAQRNPALCKSHILSDHEGLPRVLVADLA